MANWHISRLETADKQRGRLEPRIGIEADGVFTLTEAMNLALSIIRTVNYYGIIQVKERK